MEPKIDTLDQLKTDFLEWFETYKSTRNCDILCAEAIEKLARFTKSQRVMLEPFFRGFDKINQLHVSKNQMRRVLAMNAIVLSDEEIGALQKRFCDEIGFKYRKFLCAVEKTDCRVKYQDVVEYADSECEEDWKCAQKDLPKTVVEVIAKIIIQIFMKNLNFDDFLKNERGDELYEEIVHEALTDFKIDLSKQEAKSLCDSFTYGSVVNIRELQRTIQEILRLIELKQSELLQPKNNLFSSENNFLNFAERVMATKIFQKLAKHYDKVSEMAKIFEGKENIKRCDLVNALCHMRLIDFVSSREFDVIIKCFTDDMNVENSNFKSKDFLQMITHVYEMGR